MLVSGSQLAQYTGCTWRTCQKRLQRAGIRPVRRERNADLFESVHALPAILGPRERASDVELAEDLREHEGAILAALCSRAFIPAALALHERFGLDPESATRAAAGVMMLVMRAHADDDMEAEYNVTGPLEMIGLGDAFGAVREVQAAVKRLKRTAGGNGDADSKSDGQPRTAR